MASRSTGSGSRPLFGADLDEGVAGGQRHVDGTEVVGVEDAQPVGAGFHLKERLGGAVHEHPVADARELVRRRPVRFTVPVQVAGVLAVRCGERIGELVVRVEATFGDHQRHVVVAAGQPQLVLERMIDDEHPSQAHPHVAPGSEV
jgi:hypothetical protein